MIGIVTGWLIGTLIAALFLALAFTVSLLLDAWQRIGFLEEQRNERAARHMALAPWSTIARGSGEFRDRGARTGTSPAPTLLALGEPWPDPDPADWCAEPISGLTALTMDDLEARYHREAKPLDLGRDMQPLCPVNTLWATWPDPPPMIDPPQEGGTHTQPGVGVDGPDRGGDAGVEALEPDETGDGPQRQEVGRTRPEPTPPQASGERGGLSYTAVPDPPNLGLCPMAQPTIWAAIP